MSSNLSLIRRSRRVLPLLKFQQIYAKSKGELIIKGGVMSSEYGTCLHEVTPTKLRKPFCYQTLLLYLTALEQLAAMFILLIGTYLSFCYVATARVMFMHSVSRALPPFT